MIPTHQKMKMFAAQRKLAREQNDEEDMKDIRTELELLAAEARMKWSHRVTWNRFLRTLKEQHLTLRRLISMRFYVNERESRLNGLMRHGKLPLKLLTSGRLLIS